MSFTQKFDTLEISLRREITAAAESAVALTRENKSAIIIDELKQEIISLKYEHKQESHALQQEQV